MNIHVYKDDQQLGPFSLEQVQSMLQDGVFAVGDLARMEGCDSLMPVESFSEMTSESPLASDLGSASAGSSA